MTAKIPQDLGGKNSGSPQNPLALYYEDTLNNTTFSLDLFVTDGVYLPAWPHILGTKRQQAETVLGITQFEPP